MVGIADMDDARGRPIIPFYPERLRRRVAEEVIPTVMKEGRWTGEMRLLTEDGTEVPILENFFLVRDESGEPIGLGDVMVDIRALKEQEQELQRSEERFRSIFDHAPLGVALVNEEGRPVLNNHALRQILGYSEEELASMPFERFTHPDDVDKDVALFGELLAGKRDFYSIDKRYVRKDGEVVRSELTVAVSRDPGGASSHAIGMVRDITERHKAMQEIAEKRHFIERVVDTSPNLTYIYDLDEQRNVYSNQGIQRILGYSPDQILQMGDELFARLMDPASFPAVMEHQERLLQARDDEVLEVEYRMRDTSGTLRTLHSWESVFSRNPDGSPRQTCGIAVDVTDLRTAEQKLHEALERLKRSNHELEQFAYIASHDLQEPLRMIASYLQLLERRYDGELDEDAREFIGFAVDGAARLKVMIQDLLEFSRVGTRGEELAPVDSGEVLTLVRKNLEVALGESGGVLDADTLPQVLADESQLAMLFQNLIENAIKFSGENEPRIGVTARRDGALWEFAVSDNGIGIDPRYAEQIFVVFQRLHSTEDYPGSGIGLSICQKIVKRHGGRLWFESTPGDGTTFYFTLRASRTEAQ